MSAELLSIRASTDNRITRDILMKFDFEMKIVILRPTNGKIFFQVSGHFFVHSIFTKPSVNDFCVSRNLMFL